eukprot:TRINITY_DN3109_c0_g1_i1.p1 TRINITY_DN3109_c0_g1~~TRINITY_DN3109_c0_g1_i1.p1  ORF type:complete len:438 (-),score=118.72 TRINITY_DN3109_c0_g1_i1:85-1398(-)
MNDPKHHLHDSEVHIDDGEDHTDGSSEVEDEKLLASEKKRKEVEELEHEQLNQLQKDSEHDENGVHHHLPLSAHHLSSSNDTDYQTNESPEAKRMKIGQYQQYGEQPQDNFTLEAIAQGSVPDMTNSYIASLSPQPQSWAYPDVSNHSAYHQQQMAYAGMLYQQQAWQFLQQNMQRPDMHGMDPRYGMIPQPQIMGAGEGLFTLLEQPNEVQRKSYKNENRCILPNPLNICLREGYSEERKTQILEGTVTVTLVDADGEELPNHKQNILESIERSLSQQLDENLSAQFSLKVMETSEGNMFRLLFTVNYRTKGLGPCEEKIQSRPFIVYSNRKKHAKAMDKERPIPTDMKPDRCEANREAEVWIKGRGFSDKVIVTFGDRPGRIMDSSENLITVISPMREDVTGLEMSVPVTISNKFARELFSADKKMTFTYLPPRP